MEQKDYNKAYRFAAELNLKSADRVFTMEEIKKLEKEHPTYWEYKHVVNPQEYSFRVKALGHSMLKEYDQCMTACRSGLGINPKSPFLLYIMGRALGDFGQLGDGLKNLSKAIELYPNFADAYIERGAIYWKMGEYAKSRKDYMTAKNLEDTIQLPQYGKEVVEKVFDPGTIPSLVIGVEVGLHPSAKVPSTFFNALNDLAKALEIKNPKKGHVFLFQDLIWFIKNEPPLTALGKKGTLHVWVGQTALVDYVFSERGQLSDKMDNWPYKYVKNLERYYKDAGYKILSISITWFDPRVDSARIKDQIKDMMGVH